MGVWRGPLPRWRAAHLVGVDIRLIARLDPAVLGEYAPARSMFEEALAISRDRGDRQAVASDLKWFGLFLVGQREEDAAQSLLQEAMVIVRDVRCTREIAFALGGLGVVAL